MARELLERTLPHNIEAEKALLGAILVNNEAYYKIVESILPEDFYLSAHRAIFDHITDLMEQSKIADLVTIQESLHRGSLLESVGGISYLASLLEGIPHLVNIDHYIEIIREKSLLRQMIGATNKIVAECFDQAEDAEEILDRAEQSFFSLSDRRSKAGFSSLRDMELSTSHLLEKLYHDRQMITGLATGFVDLDRMTSGLQPSDLIIVAARPSMGKTALCLNLAQNVAKKYQKSVGMFSLEMSKQQLMLRMLCADARVDAHKVRTGYLGKEDFRKLIDTLGGMAQWPIYIDDSSTLTVMEMRSKCRRLKAEKGLDLIIVDYLQLMSGYGRVENRTQEVSGISRGLKSLAKELNVPVIALSQLSRAPEQRQGEHKPQLSDLRESGSIEQDADLVMFIYREEVYKPDDENLKGKADLIVAKQRNGPIGIVKLAFLREFTAFDNLFEP
jgi:replicative DNA helicase